MDDQSHAMQQQLQAELIDPSIELVRSRLMEPEYRPLGTISCLYGTVSVKMLTPGVVVTFSNPLIVPAIEAAFGETHQIMRLKKRSLLIMRKAKAD